jgi:subtilase family serine protease
MLAGGTAPADATCAAAYGVSECFSPATIETAYAVTGLLAAGDDGAGQSIVIIDSYGSPSIRRDLRAFDAGYGLPAPPALNVIAPLGRVPFDAADNDQVGWADETTLDVEWAHALAPDATIDLLTSPVDETEGTAGLGDFLRLERYALDHHLGHILSQSWAATEQTLATRPGRRLVAAFERFYARADRAGWTILAAAGDTGTANPSSAVGTATYPYPTVNFPASSPLVTAVGGTHLRTAADGTWVSERVWNNGVSGGAGGGGVSRFFAEPSWQRGLPAPVQAELRGHRGVPDVSWDADPSTGVLISITSGPADGSGWNLIGGTSAGAPQWAGLVADIDQARGAPLGLLNPAIYAAGEGPFHDITTGTNAFGGVRGYRAVPGWDPASGLGTPDAALLAPVLTAAVGARG